MKYFSPTEVTHAAYDFHTAPCKSGVERFLDTLSLRDRYSEEEIKRAVLLFGESTKQQKDDFLKSLGINVAPEFKGKTLTATISIQGAEAGLDPTYSGLQDAINRGMKASSLLTLPYKVMITNDEHEVVRNFIVKKD